TTVHGPRLKSNQSELWQWILEFRNSDCGFRISAYQLTVLRLTIQNNCNYRVFNFEIRNSNSGLYLFENWKRFRAPFCPYFFRSLMRGSRVIKPACLRAGRRSALYSSSARVMPCRIAPAWPAGPPPATLITKSNLFVVSVNCNGCRMIMRSVSLGK